MPRHQRQTADMKLLAIDTSTDACSVAIQSGDDVEQRHVIAPREHTKILLPAIEELLQVADLALTDLDAVVLGNGPGSFIGMRIGASVVQGICFGSGLEIAPVSSLAAIAAEALQHHECENVVVAQDARMHEVYLGCYARGENNLPVAVDDEAIRAIGELHGLPAQYIAAGGAWTKFGELQTANSRHIVVDANILVPQACFLLDMGVAVVQAGKAIPPASLEPAYIRVKVAEIPVSPSKAGAPS
jgi:tRNA threonylcarbamoyladenosine biosynthesis protein TsaB